jgi:choline dehydrogenase-like flavoprotein
MMPEFDVIVVGGGTAGVLCARRLSECIQASVLVLEAGPPFPHWALSVPLASYRLRRPWSWRYRSVPQTALGGRRIHYPMEDSPVNGTFATVVRSVSCMWAQAGR